MPAKLLVTAGPDKGRAFPLIPGETLQIGRSQATSTRLTDVSVSRVHCEIEVTADEAVLHNISANGTLVNGKTAAEQRLQPGDVIRIGATELHYLTGDASEDTTVEQPPAPTQALPLTSLVGRTLSHYTVGAVIARGASGVVFKATDSSNGQAVALKVLNLELSRDEEEMQRFVRAMKTMLPLRHPNLVAVHGAGKSGPYCWCAMQLVEGESLTQVIQRIGVAGMLDWKHAYRVAVHVARALEYAHAQAIIHRNVTPQNILLRTEDKTALLGDLMLAKALEGSLALQVTRQGELVGDLAYMAPERTRGTTDSDGRSDLYGLGATVYALLTGRPPFGGGTAAEVIAKIRTAEPEKPKKYQLSIPDQFQGVVLKLLAKRPEERYQTATDLLVDLQRVGKLTGASA
jgi:serine/threonine protein kinase